MVSISVILLNLCFIVHYLVVVKALETRTSVPILPVEQEGEQMNWKLSFHRRITPVAQIDLRTLTPATSVGNRPDRSQTVHLKLKNFSLDYKIDHQELCCDVHVYFFPLIFVYDIVLLQWKGTYHSVMSNSFWFIIIFLCTALQILRKSDKMFFIVLHC